MLNMKIAAMHGFLKQKSRVLLLIPPFPSDELGGSSSILPRAPHVGVGYLSEFLKKHGVEHNVLDLRFTYGRNKTKLSYTINHLRKKINEFKPDLIGITMMSYRHDLSYEIIKQIKNEKYKIVVGGPHVSTFRKKILEDCEADFAIKLEGEYTLLELCQGMNPADIKGLIFRDGENIIENEDRPFIKNLDSLGFPCYEKFDLERYVDKAILIVSSRGCPFKCIYCPIKVTMGREFRIRSPESIIEEIKYWYKRGYRNFSFEDDNFTLIKERVYKFCDLLEELNLKDLVLTCPNGVRPDCVDRDLLKRMREVGFNQIYFGVEAGNNKVLKRIKKGERIETIEEAIKNACDLGYKVGLFFMVGHPGETPSDVEDSIRLALKYPVTSAAFYNIIPFPNTELFDWISENNYFVVDWEKHLNYVAHFNNSPFFETPEFSLGERKKALDRTAKISKKIKKASFERSFSKYKTINKIAAQLLYSGFTYRFFLKHFRQSKLFRKIVFLILEKFRLKIYHI